MERGLKMACGDDRLLNQTVKKTRDRTGDGRVGTVVVDAGLPLVKLDADGRMLEFG
jgi:hypothetical protein